MKRSTWLALFLAVAAAVSMHVIARAQANVGQNINVITGSSDQFTGDMFRQRQNESVGGISSVNPSTMMVAYNDYRTVDFREDSGSVVPPSPIQVALLKLRNFFVSPWRRERERVGEAEEEAGPASAQAFIGLSFSDNGGKDWYTGLHPGHHSLPAAQGTESWDQSPQLIAFDAASDPVMASTHNQFFVGGIAFNPGGQSTGFVSRFTDRNDTETGQNIHFDGTKLLLTQPANFFVDKPSIAAALGADGKTYVYAAFVVFDQTDPLKLSSTIQFFRSEDAGVSWTQQGLVVSQPLTRNQSPWLVVDPNNAKVVYIGWRVFAARAGGLANAIVGRKSTNAGVSFTPSVPYPVAVLLKPFDQPQGKMPASLPIPRSNAYPTAAIDGNGVIHVALQEYVYPSNYPIALLRGLPLAPGVPVSTGVPRITVTSSPNGGVSWTPRTAIDLAGGAGTQFMPVLTTVGEPGPSCGSAGPRSRIMVMYYDARAGRVGLTPGGTGFVAGGDTQFDVRIAEASACIKDGVGRPIFGASQQVSRYSLSATPPHGIVTTAGFGKPSVNKAYGIFCGGFCAFSGDYIHAIPRQSYVNTSTGWKLTTATGVPSNAIPAPVVQGFWADTRNVILPTEPPINVLPNQPGFIDSLPFYNYQSPGSGNIPSACQNAGARDQNVYSAEYAPGNLFAAAPVTFRRENIPHAYPLYVENRAAQQRFFRLTIHSSDASFDFRSFDPSSPTALDLDADIAIGPYSTVTGSVVVRAGVNAPVLVTVQELASTINSQGVVRSDGALLTNGASTSVTIFTAGAAAPTTTETHTPVVSQTPTVTRPLPPQSFPINVNPFTQQPFTQQPFTQQTSILNPFTQQPFTQQTTIFDIIDVSFPVTLGGDQAAALAALLNLQNAEQFRNNYLFQVIISRLTSVPGLNGCQSFDGFQDIQVSNIRAPFTQQPFTQQPFTQQPFTQQPFTQQPFTQQPFTQQPFTQQTNPDDTQTDPRDPTISTSTFYLSPPATPGQTARLDAPRAGAPSERVARRDGDARIARVGLTPTAALPTNYRADRGTVGLLYTLRAFQIRATNATGFVSLFGAGGNPKVGVTIVTDTPEVIVVNGVSTFDPRGRTTSSGGAAVPVKLSFTVQPTSTAVGQLIYPPVQVAIQDGFGNTITNSTQAVTIALGNNPSTATLSGTLTTNAVNGIATFSNLRINKRGFGYTLVASSPNLAPATSQAFTVGILIAGNSAAVGNGPIAIFDFANGATVGSFVPSGAAGGNNGRGIAILGNEVFYTELTTVQNDLSFSITTDYIRVAPFNGGAGGGDIRTIPNPRPGFGIADLTFSGGVLYVLSGYASDLGPLQVFRVNPANGDVLSPPVTISGSPSPFAQDADGFTVLPNGRFLINNEDASCEYNQYDASTGALVPGTTITVPGGIDILEGGGCTGVETDGVSLYFQRNFNSIVQTDLAGNLIASVPVSAPSPGCAPQSGFADCIEDIALVFTPTALQINSDQSAFVAATGATSATGPLPNVGVALPGLTPSYTVGTVRFSLGPAIDQVPAGDDLSIGTGRTDIPDWYGPLAGNDVALGWENFIVDFGTPVHGMGFFFAEPKTSIPPYGGNPVDSPYQIRLYNGETLVLTLTFNAPDDQVVFVSVTSDVPFTRAWIFDTTGNDDDEYFGEFYKSP